LVSFNFGPSEAGKPVSSEEQGSLSHGCSQNPEEREKAQGNSNNDSANEVKKTVIDGPGKVQERKAVWNSTGIKVEIPQRKDSVGGKEGNVYMSGLAKPKADGGATAVEKLVSVMAKREDLSKSAARAQARNPGTIVIERPSVKGSLPAPEKSGEELIGGTQGSDSGQTTIVTRSRKDRLTILLSASVSKEKD
jgi:hypothetical protein